MNNAPFGILLAGGRAQRMGGGDKALKTIGGSSILARVIAAMRPQCAALVLNANGDAARLEDFGLPVVADDLEGFKGPLAGILAGLDWVASHHPDIDFAISAPTVRLFCRSTSSRACGRTGRTATRKLRALLPLASRIQSSRFGQSPSEKTCGAR